MTQNGHEFMWRLIHEKEFQEINALASRTPVLKPIDPKAPDPIWVVCDASTSGVGAFYGQGPKWEVCRPAGFMSKKFQEAQFNYCVFEMGTLAILEALLKWEDKLIGRKFTVVTDHKPLEFFSKQQKLSGRQERWAKYLSRFDFEIVYVQGKENIVAGCLSRCYKFNTKGDKHPSYVYVSADLLFGYDVQLQAARIDFKKPTSIPRPSEKASAPGPTLNLEDIVGPSSHSLPIVMSIRTGSPIAFKKGMQRTICSRKS